MSYLRKNQSVGNSITKFENNPPVVGYYECQMAVTGFIQILAVIYG